jgi:hypothetical protein
MNITVLSRERLIAAAKANEDFARCLIISFYDEAPPDVRGAFPKATVFQYNVPDIDIDELPEFGLTYDDYWPGAKEIAGLDFKKFSRIICQCEHGQSRSAGCAAALAEFFDHSGIDYFSDYDLYPNKLIYHRLMEELKLNKKVI